MLYISTGHFEARHCGVNPDPSPNEGLGVTTWCCVPRSRCFTPWLSDAHLNPRCFEPWPSTFQCKGSNSALRSLITLIFESHASAWCIQPHANFGENQSSICLENGTSGLTALTRRCVPWLSWSFRCILLHGVFIHTKTSVKIGPAVVEIWALLVFAVKFGAVHLDQMQSQPDLALILALRILHTNFGPNRLKTVDLYSKQTYRQTDKQIELYKVDGLCGKLELRTNWVTKIYTFICRKTIKGIVGSDYRCWTEAGVEWSLLTVTQW